VDSEWISYRVNALYMGIPVMAVLFSVLTTLLED